MVRSSGKILKLSVALIGILSLLIIYFLLISTGLIQTNVKHLVLTSEGSQMVYDGTKLTHEKWAFSSGELSKGDRAIVRFTGSQTEIGTSNNTFVATIYDNQDNDVTNKYNIDYDYGRLEVLKRPITISALSETKNYDGEELVIDEDSYQILSGSLLPGHKTEIKVSGSITNVGITNTRLSGKIIDENGFDVSNLYDMDLRDGNLEIRPLPITIKTKNTEYFKYDGQIHTFSDKEFEITTKSASDDSFRESLDYIVGTLINEDKLIISDFTKEINAGVYQNSVKFRVLNKVGYDVTSNYNIKVNTGELRIEAKTLHVKTNGAQKVYDGLPLTNSEVSYTEEDLLPGDVALVEALGSVTNAGSVKNEASVIVRNSTGEDISKNYHVILDAGSLTINKFSIRLRAIDLSKKYDGTKLSFETSGKEKAYETITELPNWFVEDFKIIATTAGELTDYKAGGVEHRILNAKILDKNGTNVTQNFEISQISGRIEILQHELLVSTCDVLGIYDGTSKKVLDGFSEEGYRITGFDLNDPIFKNIEIKPSLVHDGIEPYDGLNELQIIAKRFTEDGTIDVSKNFSIAYDGKAGRYNVAPRTFAIETYKIEKDFTGEEYIFPKDDGKDYFHYNEEDLVEGHTLVINKNSVRGRIPGEYNYEIIYDIVDENGIVVTKYYNCHESFSKLIINKRSLVLSIPNYSYKYDSTEKVFNLKAEYLSEVDRNLFNLSGEDQDKLRISLDEKTFIYPEDSVKNTTLDIKIFDGDEDVTNFFSIKNAALTFTIEKPVITISSHSQEFKYDTKNPDAIYKCEEADINDNELVPGHNLDYSFNVSITASP